MDDLTADQFGDFFRAVHGHDPYPWQRRLAVQVLETGWPDVIDLPTGVGKTAVLDIAVFALAARPDVSPRRIVFVIDRRIVVDQVYEHAEGISKALLETSGGVLTTMQTKLRDLSGDQAATAPLGISALRGGIPLDGAWPSRPDKPWVMVSTVDQFGSRLLFRGYGVSDRSRPIHAGLAGNDCLVILDEVHLSRAFASTLAEATSDGIIPMMRSMAGGLPRRFKVVEMSATPGRTGSRFELLLSDLEAPKRLKIDPEPPRPYVADRSSDREAAKRLKMIAEAEKTARLVELKGKPQVAVPKQVLEIVKNELRDDERSVGVIVNRVRTARETCQALRHKNPDIDVHLVTGRMRPIDRQRVMGEVAGCVAPDREMPLKKRTVVVATQAVEVGADFSFDALISEAAPIDSLVQRLGRLDRRGTLSAGRNGPARCWILGLAGSLIPKNPDDPQDPKNPDPVYGAAVFHTWRNLQDHEDDAGQIDVSPAAGLLASMPAETRAPKTEAPLLLPTYIAAWTQTNPQPVADPPIGEFLHGKKREQQPDVTLVWRWDRSAEALNLVPPRQAEFLAVPLSAVKGWLAGEAEVPVSDLDLAAAEDRPSVRQAGRPTVRLPRLASVVRWSRSESDPVERLARAEDIKPGDVIVADPRIGGLRNGTWDPSTADAAAKERDCSANDDEAAKDDEPSSPSPSQVRSASTSGHPSSASDEVVPSGFSHDNQATEVSDLGDEAQLAHGIRATLRLDPRLFSGVSIPGLDLPAPRDEQNASSPRREIIEAWLRAVAESSEALPAWLLEIVRHLRSSDRRFDVEVVGRDADEAEQHDSGAAEPYYVLVERAVDPAILDEADDTPSLTGSETTLSDHLVGVGQRAADYGKRLSLSDELVKDLRLAGELHDLGKIDDRFQAQMVGHDPVRMATLDEPLAKSVRGARPRRDAWPPVRHEFSSVALAQSVEASLGLAHDADLVLHLVGTHHGYGRPLAAIMVDDQPRPLEVSGLIQDDEFRLSSANGAAAGSSASDADFLRHAHRQRAVPADLHLAAQQATPTSCDGHAVHKRQTAGESAQSGGPIESVDGGAIAVRQSAEQCCSTDSGGDKTGRSVTMATCSDLGATSLALDMADRFWRLQERYGHHGLAWLEAIFRLADWQQSREEAQRG